MHYSKFDLLIIALIGKLIVVRLKFPVNIFLPIYFKISLATDLYFFIIAVSVHAIPPYL
jgi:hypothetical protein